MPWLRMSSEYRIDSLNRVGEGVLLRKSLGIRWKCDANRGRGEEWGGGIYTVLIALRTAMQATPRYIIHMYHLFVHAWIKQ